MFGTQHTTVGGHTVDCQLSAVSSFFVTLDAQTLVFGWLEVLIPFIVLVVVLVVVLWPFVSQYLVNVIPYSAFNFFETMNWMQFGRDVEQSLLHAQNAY